jgi:CRISPR-associated protein Cmr6
MGVTAIPQKYYQHWMDFIEKAPPGHKFGPFFNIWSRDWSIPKEGKIQALKDVCALGRDASNLLNELLNRQKRMVQLCGEDIFSISGMSSSPFMTGVGMEHPLEIGFAFLNPYGIPYLPGASVKGVIRKAAEDLALGFYGDQTDGWSILDVWWLFGFEAESAYLTGKAPIAVEVLKNKACDLKNEYLNYVQTTDPQQLNDLVIPFIKKMLSDEKLTNQYKEQPKLFLQELSNTENKNLRDSVSNRGALVFWDVFPKTAKLEVDILTPHYIDYYEGKTSPADCGQPKPNSFLTIPTNSEFNFNIQCDTVSLPEILKVRWKVLVQAAFEIAFALVGFGAKTSVGYGRIQFSTGNSFDVKKYSEGGSPDRLDKIQKKAPNPIIPDSIMWENAFISYTKNTGEIMASIGDKKAISNDKSIVSDHLLVKLTAKKTKPISANVEVEPYGNRFRLLKIFEENK